MHFIRILFVSFIYGSVLKQRVLCQKNLSSLSWDNKPTISSYNERRGRIVGGIDAEPGALPFIASLTRRGGHFCGATVINEQWLLTAAHCVCNGFNTIIGPNQIKAVLGLHKISEYKKRKSLAENNEPIDAYEVSFKNIVVHPNYKCRKPESDIALLELSEPIKFSSSVKPASITAAKASDNNAYDGEIAIISGWGYTNENQEIADKPDILQHARVKVWNNHKCQQSFKQQKKPHVITTRQLCAGEENGGVDSCWADSGGPLISNENVLIGVVSTGVGCGRPGLPGIYTRVSEYTKWIKDTVLSSTV